VINLSKVENVVSIISYKEKKIQEFIHTRYTQKLIEGTKIVQELESLMHEIENEHGLKIFKEIWKALSSNDQMETEYYFDALIRKYRDCKNKAIPSNSYPSKPSL